MTKHFFSAELPDRQPVSVDVGWDRPLQVFYMNVTAPLLPEDDQDVYVSLYDPRVYAEGRPGALRGGLSLEEVGERLTELGITPPVGLLEALKVDREANVGNAVRHW
ncbi:hypothetical protein [Deinococcus soli (ex Cha et al. 2016)]|uniref:hypothetical protein n=1 Tax=Deinococcus soli (ex Cha et al. 2016) TaxID=1309411 RepID=UPI0016668267|nr:hypothetical protein [Deinococcus soli (ex Cha et al. 2016)]